MDSSIGSGDLLDRSTLSTTMDFTAWKLAQDLVGTTLDDTSSNWQASGAFKPEIDLTSGLSTLIDTPSKLLVLVLKLCYRLENTYQTIKD